MNYLLFSTMMIAAIDSTFGRGCDCCKKLCRDKDSSEPSINSENNKTNVEDELIKVNEEENKIGTIYSLDADSYKSQENSSRSDGLGGVSSNDKENEVLNNNKGGNVETNTKEEILYYKIVDKNDNSVQSCFCQNWYEQRKEGGVQLVSLKEKDNSDVLEVIGKGNNWRIVDKNGDSFKYNNCDPSKKTWIIFSITLWDSHNQKPGETLTFYVDDISLWEGNLKFEGNILKELSAFNGVQCYTWTLLHANTANVRFFNDLFWYFSSVLEKDENTNLPGLKGLEKFNMTNALNISRMFSGAIYKQDTLSQLSKWKFGDNFVFITELFHSSSSEELDFHALDGWATNCNNENSKFMLPEGATDDSKKEIFFSSSNPDVNKLPNWFENIG